MTRQLDVASAIDDLRQLIAKTDALANATEDQFDGMIWGKDDHSARSRERVSHLVGATAEAARAAVEASDKLAAELISQLG